MHTIIEQASLSDRSDILEIILAKVSINSSRLEFQRLATVARALSTLAIMGSLNLYSSHRLVSAVESIELGLDTEQIVTPMSVQLPGATFETFGEAYMMGIELSEALRTITGIRNTSIEQEFTQMFNLK